MDSLQKRVFSLLREAKVSDRQHRMGLASWILLRDVTTFKDLSVVEYQAIADTLAGWQGQGVLVERAGQYGPVPGAAIPISVGFMFEVCVTALFVLSIVGLAVAIWS